MPSCRVATLIAFALLTPVAHAAPLIGGLGGPGPNGGYGTGGPLMPNDDGSSDAIDLSVAFPAGLNFYGKTYKAMYVNTNGNITFNAKLSTYTPAAFPIASQPMIAPFWGDVDTRGNGMPATNGIWWFSEAGRAIITWSQVGYYNTHDNLKNDFQLILSSSDCGSSDFDVEFRYNQCQWITGDASGGSMGMGGTPAQAGFDAGDTKNFVTVPDSRTAAIINLCTTSNVGIPGVWRFLIRNGAIAGGCTGGGMPCDTGQMGACAAGINQCSGAGVVCNPMVASAAEKCDGVDNDCNGMTDEGDGLCGLQELCDRGRCVGVCFAEISCQNPTDVCTDRGTCVEPACAMVDCPPGQRCKGGVCQEPCGGVTCPHGQVCRVGRCVDPCDGVTCGTNQICEGGVCVPTCQCQPCMPGNTCKMDGHCAATDCATVTCPAGQFCMGGTCADNCSGAVCPDGQLCMAGACVPAPVLDMTVLADMTALPDLGAAPDLTSEGTGEADNAPVQNARRSAAGCDVTPGAPAASWMLIFFVALLAARRRSRT
jgi:hypothetical protein